MTPLGHGAWPTFRALLGGKTIASRIPILPEDISEVDLVRALGGVSFAQHTANDPAVDLAERAAREACDQAGIPTAGLPMWIGSSKGAVTRLSTCLGIGYLLDRITAEILAVGPHAYVSNQLALRLGTHTQTHHVAACASALVALDAARRALVHQTNESKNPYALVLTSEAALTPAFIHSYRRLGVLSEPTPATYIQRPLDQQRSGFMLAQAGAAVLLRRLEIGEAPKPGEIELVDTATACEASHLIRTPPKMEALAHIAGRLLKLHQAEVLHPHAPGTPEHDPRELRVLLNANGKNVAPLPKHEDASEEQTAAQKVYACKGALGHTLGSAGLVSLVLAWMCLRTGKVPPMPWLQDPMELEGDKSGDASANKSSQAKTLALGPNAQTCTRQGTHAIFAAGFGGHTAGAVIRGHNPK